VGRNFGSFVTHGKFFSTGRQGAANVRMHRDQAFHLFLRRSLRDPAIQDPVEDDLSLSLFGRLRYRDGNEGLDGTWRLKVWYYRSLIMVVLDGSRDVCIVAFHLRVLERQLVESSWIGKPDRSTSNCLLKSTCSLANESHVP
jgi:hypothetical protein